MSTEQLYCPHCLAALDETGSCWPHADSCEYEPPYLTPPLTQLERDKRHLLNQKMRLTRLYAQIAEVMTDMTETERRITSA